MLDAEQHVLYVGKAKDLKSRLSSYFRGQQSYRIEKLVSQIQDIRTTVTETENEALLLEHTLIKTRKPRYNILLRDDKSYPYIALTSHHPYPRLYHYRKSAKKNTDKLYGPYPNGYAVHKVLDFIQKAFKIRNCNDTFFKHRTRPCLQYQIKRCTAPCVGYISQAAYAKNIAYAISLVEGKDKVVLKSLASDMQKASDALEYEKAAEIRNRLQDIQQIASTQIVVEQAGDKDVIAVCLTPQVIVTVLVVRNGHVLGSEHFYPKTNSDDSAELLNSFMKQHYLSKDAIPPELIIPFEIPDAALLSDVLSEKRASKVQIRLAKKGTLKQLMTMASENAHHQARQYKHHAKDQALWQSFVDVFKDTVLPQEIACFDISHSSGEATVASCVVFNENGPNKKAYRRFHIDNIKAGDDIAAMCQAIERFIAQRKKQSKTIADVIIVDGGKTHLKHIHALLKEKEVSSVVLSIYKGPGRKPEYDKIASIDQTFLFEGEAKTCVQRVRDEAHRFALAGHRKLLNRKRRAVLENIEGLGPRKRKALLEYFGGLQQIKASSKQDLKKAPGISDVLAKRIYEYFHRT